MVFPIARQRVIVILLSQLFIVAKCSHNLGEVLRQCRAVRAFGLAFQVALNCPDCLIVRIKYRLEFAESHGFQVSTARFLHCRNGGCIGNQWVEG